VTPDTRSAYDEQATGFRALNDGRDSKLTGTYIQVLVLEAAIIAALLIFARIYS
jgi:hypothetical protein